MSVMGYSPCVSLLATMLLAGCGFGTRYPRFDEAGVVSLNPLRANTDKLSEAEYRSLADLEGSWVVTNKYQRKPSPSASTGRTTNQLGQPRTAVPSPVRSDEKPQEVEVVTVLTVDSKGAMVGPSATIETYTGGSLKGRSSYVPIPLKLKDDIFLELRPDALSQLLFLLGAEVDHPPPIPTYLFMKIRPKGLTLEVGRLNEEWLRKLLEKKPRSIRHLTPLTNHSEIVLTDTSQALQLFLRRHAGKPGAFELTTFSRQRGGVWSAEDLRKAAKAAIDVLARTKVAEKFGDHEAIIQVSEIANQSGEPIDTAFLSSVLRRSFDGTLNNFFYLNPNLAGKITSRMTGVFELSGAVVKSNARNETGGAARYQLQLKLKNKEGKVLWEYDQPLSRSD